MTEIVDAIVEHLSNLGISNSQVVRSTFSESFGDAEIIVGVDQLRFRFISDRSWIHLDLAGGSEPDSFYQFDDVAMALGWKEVKWPIGAGEPESVEQVCQKLRGRLTALKQAFSPDDEKLTRSRIVNIASKRQEAIRSWMKS